MNMFTHRARAFAAAAVLVLAAGCTSPSKSSSSLALEPAPAIATSRPVPDGPRNVTILGQVSTIDRADASRYLAPGSLDTYYVLPGVHEFTVPGVGRASAYGIAHPPPASFRLNLLARRTYEIDVQGRVRIHDVAENRTIFFDRYMLVFYGEDRAPVDPAKDPLAR